MHSDQPEVAALQVNSRREGGRGAPDKMRKAAKERCAVNNTTTTQFSNTFSSKQTCPRRLTMWWHERWARSSTRGTSSGQATRGLTARVGRPAPRVVSMTGRSPLVYLSGLLDSIVVAATLGHLRDADAGRQRAAPACVLRVVGGGRRRRLCLAMPSSHDTVAIRPRPSPPPDVKLGVSIAGGIGQIQRARPRGQGGGP